MRLDLLQVDLLAPLFLVGAWMGYALYADGGRRQTLMARMRDYRLAWMRQMMGRDNRIVDTQITSLLVQNISFFASSAILLIGGLVAILGAREQAMAIIADIPLAAATPAGLWEIKVLLLALIFVYAFFKFTWSLRQFNYVAILIGATPPPEEAGSTAMAWHIERTASVASRAADHFNKAMRAYYFGLAALSWFVHPWLLVAATLWVLVVNWRREFRSHSYMLLGEAGEPVGAPQERPGQQASP
ncbi:DUF599 domain-containing protein [Geminicoccaceae bacterium 1502E]|nr:DUF599 domain-containing protein [Geminicoccaceae bacterium 1502E]